MNVILNEISFECIIPSELARLITEIITALIA